MIEEGTTITRILDKLEDAGYISRERSEPDRRQVVCVATAAGVRLLDKIDPAIDAADEEAVASLSAREVAQLIDLLDAVRATNAERGAPRTMIRASTEV
jgi:DNA-binding MarR family transcriptional regulator